MPDPTPSMTPAEQDRLGELTFRYLDGLIDDAELAELNALLRGHEEARRLFAAYGRERFVLRDLLTAAHEEADAASILDGLASLEAEAGPVEPVDLTEELKRRGRATKQKARREAMRLSRQGGDGEHRPLVIPKWIVLASAAAVALAVVLAIAGVFDPEPKQVTRDTNDTNNTPAQPDREERPAVAFVAEVRSSIDARWGGTAHDQPTRLAAGHAVTLTQGLAQVVFDDGAAVIIQAPATFEPYGTNGMRLIAGKLTADVPPGAVGFTVQTPGGLITDYGTEFGVIVNHDGQTLAHTFTGRIGLTPTGGGAEVALSAGDVAIADTRGRVRTVEHDALAFVRQEEYAARASSGDDAYARWLAYSYELRRDPGVVLYYALEQDDFTGRTIHNRVMRPDAAASNGTAGFDGSAPGRFTQKPAALFDSDGDHIAATLDRPMEAVTLAGWYWVDQMRGSFAALLHSDGTVPTHGIHWHLNTNHGDGWSIEFVQNRRRGAPIGYWHDALSSGWSPPSLAGRWVHLALVYDTASGDAWLYLDGRAVQQATVDETVPVRLGDFRLGNWYAPVEDRHEDWPRPLRGRIDEFVVLDRALSAQDIAAMYDAGRPDN